MTDKDKLEKAVKFADAMYHAAQYLTTDASRLRRAMEDYHQFIITEYNKQEPASEDLSDLIDKLSKRYPEVSFAKLSRIAVSAAKWQREQMMKGAIDTRIDKRLADMIGYTGSERVKVIIIKE